MAPTPRSVLASLSRSERAGPRLGGLVSIRSWAWAAGAEAGAKAACGNPNPATRPSASVPETLAKPVPARAGGPLGPIPHGRPAAATPRLQSGTGSNRSPPSARARLMSLARCAGSGKTPIICLPPDWSLRRPRIRRPGFLPQPCGRIGAGRDRQWDALVIRGKRRTVNEGLTVRFQGRLKDAARRTPAGTAPDPSQLSPVPRSCSACPSSCAESSVRSGEMRLMKGQRCRIWLGTPQRWEPVRYDPNVKFPSVTDPSRAPPASPQGHLFPMSMQSGRRVGVAVVGLGGAVATTAIAGIEMIKAGSNARRAAPGRPLRAGPRRLQGPRLRRLGRQRRRPRRGGRGARRVRQGRQSRRRRRAEGHAALAGGRQRRSSARTSSAAT